MSGVFGAIGYSTCPPVTDVARRMARAMSHRPWYVADCHGDDGSGVAIGRIGIGILNRSPQPLWDSTHTIALVIAGEFYRDAAAGREPAPSDEQVALDLYQAHGPQFAKHLNGQFVIAVWDATARRLVITNDRHGLYPLYYSCRRGRLAFAPEVKGILCDTSARWLPDLTALAQYMRFQHLLGDRTFHEDIRLLPPASVLSYDVTSAACTVTQYWTFNDIPFHPDIRFEEAVEETGHLLRRAARRLSGDGLRPGIYLSGGLDSRTLLGLTDRRPIATVTFGRHGCRDVRLAARIARVAGSDHHWFDLPDGRWVEEQADFHLTLTEGFHSWIHAHGITTLAGARGLMDVNLTGWDGGSVMGHPDSIEPLLTDPVDDNAFVTRLFYLFNQAYTWPSLLEAEEELLYAEPIRATLRGRAFESFREEVAPYLGCRTDVRSEYFYMRNHDRRLTHSIIDMLRSHIEVRCPYFDYDLIDFLYSVPARLRADRRLFWSVIRRETPRLARIPHDHDELLPTTSPIRRAHAALVRLKRRINRHIRPVFREAYTLYADYEGYLRHELRPWAEGILYDRQTTERGVFNPSFVRTLMNRHLSGQEHWTIGKIAPVITYELVRRRFFDQAPSV